MICASFGCARLHGPPSEMPVLLTNVERMWVVWLVDVLRKMRYERRKPWCPRAERNEHALDCVRGVGRGMMTKRNQ